MLGTSIFSFSHNVFKPSSPKYGFCKLHLFWRLQNALNLDQSEILSFGKELINLVGTHEPCLLNPFPNKPWFLCVCSTSLLKPLREKEKLLVTSNFSFSYIVFYLFRELSAIFIQFEIIVCKLFQFGRV